MNNLELEKLVDLIKSPIKDIKSIGDNLTEIEFENGQIIPLYGQAIEINYVEHKCNFCGGSQLDKVLFTKDDITYICTDCSILAVETFLKNGVEIKLNLGDSFPELTELIEKVNQIKKSEEP